MIPLVIVGAGGHADEMAFLLADILRHQPQLGYTFAGFVVESPAAAQAAAHKHIWGLEADLLHTKHPTGVMLGVGNPNIMLQVYTRLKANPHLTFPNLIHPSVIYCAKTLQMGEGNVLGMGSMLTTNIRLGNANCLNRAVQLGHNCTLGDANLLNPGAILSGGCTLGHANLIGTHATLLQYTELGNHNQLGAAALLTRPAPGHHQTWVGVPAKPRAPKNPTPPKTPS